MSTAWSSAHELHKVLMIKVMISTFVAILTEGKKSLVFSFQNLTL